MTAVVVTKGVAVANQKTARLAAGEIEMLQMLWREDGVTIMEAQQSLGLPIGYTTVQTRLNRLVRKGVATKSKERPARYFASVSADEVRGADLDLLVDKVSDGKVCPLVAHLVSRDSVSREELTELKRLISEAERRIKQGRRKSK